MCLRKWMSGWWRNSVAWMWLVLFVFTVGCASIPVSRDEAARMTERELIASASTWYGPLLNRDWPEAGIWDPGRGPGQSLDPIMAEVGKWVKNQRRTRRFYRRSRDWPTDFYREIDHYCPMTDVAATRRVIQDIIALPGDADVLTTVEPMAIAAEHAVLVRNAIHAGHGVALGDYRSSWAVTSFRALLEFRREFAALLPDSTDMLAQQERESYDATGAGLVDALDSFDPFMDFYTTPLRRVLAPDVPAPELPKDKPEMAEWEEVDRLPIATTAAPSSLTDGRTWFALTATVPRKLPEDGAPRLFVWAASQPCKVFLNGVLIGKGGPENGASTTFSALVDRKLIAPGETAVIVLEVEASQRSLPCRAVLLAKPGN